MCVHSLITRLQLKKMSVMYESAHDAITFHLLEMSSITTHNQKQFRIFAQGTFFKGYSTENIGGFTELHYEKINLEVSCKRHRFCYWNLCKPLPNFVNVAALQFTHIFIATPCETFSIPILFLIHSNVSRPAHEILVL